MYKPKLRPHLLIDSSIHEQVVVSGFTYRVIHDFYHAALTVSWRKFIFFYVFIFLFINLIFAIFYSILPHEISNSGGRFIDAFFLSVQTMSTVGYGSISPNGDFANIVSSIEITFGIIVNALSTGLIFARFAKPMSKIIFAHHAVISCNNNAQSLDIRMANGRKTVLLDVNIEVFLCSLQKDAQDRIYRKIDRLPLIQSNIPIFQITFEVNHIIDEHSPLYRYNMQELLEKHSEIAIKITGLDEGTGQMIYCYHVYNFKKIPENYQFQELHYRKNNNTLFIDMKNFNIIEKIS
ncbi:Low temperature requirement protein LtrA (function unknown) (LtrA) (PUBMED:8534098 [Commensalibacter communis]|uniref:Inward rectifier potassium channel n=1 Tax=Commensalibacter communis TaxID=2972786 RepID=A0A9W4TN64_9PROT|nr:ion channel [Commensalibacter communis]CAI3936217.1 Low temperature requirement protein LtrA (function unknown) (LtrA) (PUBMED:8534098 [Commensalibacter communis]CAI3942574.1 Low temperature requirement protein LtrA (function unknown) (LtrA) (PUBMED:8534098 [Commensalibacter communis]CAI3944120.1 Low temperature requirement protein LtrA (function unknown) (LtrA) (PUBMED:8534098 [Commensalibacter communis]CAI3947246.1 Low temperature requirement protein LtrA (function unknown) (LtrA) (PUBMED: